MRRRDLLTALCAAGSAAAWTSVSHGQSAAPARRVGVLAPGTPERHAADPRFRAFYAAMRELRWAEGGNLEYLRRYAELRSERLPPLAQELAGLEPDVIVTASSPPALAVKAATSTIPIVILDPGDPVATGLVNSLNRPGGNVTGVSSMAPDLAAKRVDILRQAASGLARVAMLFNIAIPPSEVALREMAEAAKQTGIELRPTPIRGIDDLDDSFATIRREKVDGLIVFADPLTHSQADRIIGFAAEGRFPALYAGREFVDAGGLVSYGPSYPDMFRRGAYYVDRILKGASPADLPIEQPTRFELVINLKTARGLELTVPPALLERADEVIE